MATEVKIKIRAFPYYEDVEDPATGKDVRVEHMAKRGEVVELSDVDLARAQKFDAIIDPDEDVPEPGPQPPPEDTVEGLAIWLREERPKVEEVVDRAADDPELAQKLIDAEDIVTGQQPRTTLVEQLQAIVDAHGA